MQAAASQMQEEPMDEVMTAEEVAAYLRVHLITVRRWCRQGELSAVKVGRSYRIRRADLDRWWAQHMEGGQSTPHDVSRQPKAGDRPRSPAQRRIRKGGSEL